MRVPHALAAAALLSLCPIAPAAQSSSGPVQHLLTSGGLVREYFVYLPSGYDGSAPRPVVFFFHGGFGSASQAASSYGVVEEAEERGWIAVFPQGYRPSPLTPRTWNSGGCCGWTQANDVDDVGFFVAMLARLQVDYAVDASAVFSTGFSNGGSFSYRLGVDRPALLRAIAPVGSSLATFGPSTPIPILAIHGALDQNVPIDGGVGDGFSNFNHLSQEASVTAFLNINGGGPFGVPEVIGNGLFFKTTDPTRLADTWYYNALDGGHTWPGGMGSPIDPTDPVHMDTAATPLVFDFFDLQRGVGYEENCHGDGGDGLACTPCPCGNESLRGTLGGCLNTAGQSARLRASGIPSAGADSLRMEITGAYPDAFALLISADNLAPNSPLNPCFGLGTGIPSSFDGLRCVVGQFRRHGSRPIDSEGSVGVTTSGWGVPDGPENGLIADAGFAAGQTRHYQSFYRDLETAGCLTGLNTTQSVSVTFRP